MTTTQKIEEKISKVLTKDDLANLYKEIRSKIASGELTRADYDYFNLLIDARIDFVNIMSNLDIYPN